MIADDLGSWAAALCFDDLSEHAVHTVRQRFVDTLGCGLGAFHAEPSRAARRLARALPLGPSDRRLLRRLAGRRLTRGCHLPEYATATPKT
ncbi:MmgE/PrpD family protein [Lentzea atacamensis]|uniref:MmgE/PrpD family protein n=1 Tax=Lentzea atacamensis TaxID=531938 RepID=UPI000D6D6C9D